MEYWVYIVRCADGSLYTGTALDVDKRAGVHNTGRGAKYTRSRRPVTVVYREACTDKSTALRREIEIKRLTRDQKLALIHETARTETPPLRNGDTYKQKETEKKTMQFGSALIAVQNLERSKQFYCELLDMEITDDFGANVTLSNVLSMQALDSWRSFIGRDVYFGAGAGELYFETADMEGFLKKLSAFDVEYVHPLKEHRWGQRVVRFYDPDRHIIEVGEAISAVIRRFLASGMTPEETAIRMDVPLQYVLDRS